MFSKLVEYLDSLSEKRSIPACDCIVYHGHDVVFRHMAGFSDLEKTKPVSENDKYMMWSATKVMTNTAVMQLVDHGLLRIEDEVSKFLPEFEKMYVKDQPAKNKITIEHLMSMQGGFDYDNENPLLMEAVKQNSMASTAEIISALAKTQLNFEPGTHFHYSFCHDILARVIEVVSGLKFSDYMEKNLFEPLGMRDSGFSVLGEEARLSQQYRFEGEPLKLVPVGYESHIQFTPVFESGGGGLVSTVEDYGKFIDAMCNYGVSKSGVRIVSREAIDKMRTPRLGKASQMDFDEWNMYGYSYGLGCRTRIEKDKECPQIPIGEFGWDGFAGAYVMIDVENQIGIFYAQHVCCTPNMYDIHWGIRNLVYDALVPRKEEENLWNGFRRIDFQFEGREAVLICPKGATAGNKWLYKTEYFDAFPEFEIEMVKRGYYLANVKNETRWARPEDTESQARFVKHVSERFGLCDKCFCVGMSCGGMQAVYLAAKHPELVRAIYIDAPVLNLLSCPCAIGDASPEEDIYGEYVRATGLTMSDLINYREHPMDYAEDLKKNEIPIFMVCGDSDHIVPYHENGKILSEKMKGYEHFYEVVKEGCDHHPHGLADNRLLREFISLYY